jgi:hypothetical protein
MLKFLCCVILLPIAIVSVLFMGAVGGTGVAIYKVADAYKGRVYHSDFCEQHPELSRAPACNPSR